MIIFRHPFFVSALKREQNYFSWLPEGIEDAIRNQMKPLSREFETLGRDHFQKHARET